MNQRGIRKKYPCLFDVLPRHVAWIEWEKPRHTAVRTVGVLVCVRTQHLWKTSQNFLCCYTNLLCYTFYSWNPIFHSRSKGYIFRYLTQLFPGITRLCFNTDDSLAVYLVHQTQPLFTPVIICDLLLKVTWNNGSSLNQRRNSIWGVPTGKH
jgi:hypothetical protein